MTDSLEVDFICNKDFMKVRFIFCTFTKGIYRIQMKNLVYIHEYIF